MNDVRVGSGATGELRIRDMSVRRLIADMRADIAGRRFVPFA
jgi:hypothetical protein